MVVGIGYFSMTSIFFPLVALGRDNVPYVGDLFVEQLMLQQF